MHRYFHSSIKICTELKEKKKLGNNNVSKFVPKKMSLRKKLEIFMKFYAF